MEVLAALMRFSCLSWSTGTISASLMYFTAWVGVGEGRRWCVGGLRQSVAVVVDGSAVVGRGVTPSLLLGP